VAPIPTPIIPIAIVCHRDTKLTKMGIEDLNAKLKKKGDQPGKPEISGSAAVARAGERAKPVTKVAAKLEAGQKLAKSLATLLTDEDLEGVVGVYRRALTARKRIWVEFHAHHGLHLPGAYRRHHQVEVDA